jgi:hypothetical protein
VSKRAPAPALKEKENVAPGMPRSRPKSALFEEVSAAMKRVVALMD